MSRLALSVSPHPAVLARHPTPRTALPQVTPGPPASPARYLPSNPLSRPYRDVPPVHPFPLKAGASDNTCPKSPSVPIYRRVPSADVTSPLEVRYSFPVAAVRGGRGRLPEWSKGAVCKTVGSAYAGSSPAPATPAETAPSPAETR